MSKLMVALSLYIGLGFLFGVNALALLSGASMFTALLRGLFALMVFAGLGMVAGLVCRVKVGEAEAQQE